MGFKLRVTISYYDAASTLLAQTTLDTPEVEPAPGSTALIDTLNNLTGNLTPTELSVGMVVSLSTEDLSTLALSGLEVSYQWQLGALGGVWTDIANATLSSYTAQTADVGSALQLCFTVSDGLESITECSNPTQIVTDNNTGVTLRTLYLSLSSGTLSLTDDSQSWLGNLLTSYNLTASYQWYRVPNDGGSVDSGGTALGSSTNSYADYVLVAADDGYRHALRITLDNGDVINTALSDVWNDGGPNTDGPSQDLYLDVVRIEGESTPYGVNDTLIARLLGSTASNNLQPDSVAYQWQRASSTSPTGWEDIVGMTGNTYVITLQDVTAGELRVVATPTANGSPLTDRVSEAVDISTIVTDRLSITVVPTSDPINQGQTVGVSIEAQPMGATLTYQWYRLSGAQSGADVWPESRKINGATEANYTAVSEDQDNYLGVVVTDAGSSGLETNAVSLGRVANTTTTESFTIVGNITPTPLYEDSVGQYQAQLLRDSVVDS
ncbi:hypothetical protein BTO00_22665, partial [Vibrio campbellii]